MPPPHFKTSAHLLVCQHANCRARGSDLLYKAVWNALDTRRLAYYKTGGSVRLTESGCLGACSYGPVMCVYRQRTGSPGGTGSSERTEPLEGPHLEEAWYAAADFSLAMEVAQAAHDGAPLPEDRKYGP
ncbi:(2Fe-2S) ferredoxin domain-containing protein [Deinococcus altitudinis]|uniref:(2Fe-2S) ferredoxin domain-containing protein n=1 Tax=Deinococcus altitudinis TaxID=468914 RepID=UPI0038918BB3